MITVFGSTGNTGSIVAKELLRRGKTVRVVARNKAKVEGLVAAGASFFEGDVLDAASVSAALEGAEGAYLLLPPDLQSNDLVARNDRITQNYVAGLTKHGVKHAALLSSVGAHLPSGTGPIVTAHRAERALREVKGTVFTFVRAPYFMENVLAYAHPMKTDGVLPVFGGGEAHAFPMIATQDIALAAADALANPPKQNEILELDGPSPYSFEDAAKIASKVLGRDVKATALPIDAMVPTLQQFGFSANVAGLFREMTEAFGNGTVRMEGVGRVVRGKTTFDTVLGALRS